MRNIISKILFTLLVLTMGIGSVWGTDQTFTVEGPAASKRYVQDNVLIGGTIGSKKLANVGSQACFYMASGSYAPIYVLSKAANIKSITIEGNRDSGSSDTNTKAFNLFTSSDLSSFATPTTGFTASRTNNGTTTSVTSLSDIPMVGNNQSYITSVTISFSTPVMGIRLTYSNSTSIKSVSVTYDDAITVADQLCEVHMTSTTAATLTGTGTFTKTNIQLGNTYTDTESTPNDYYYNKTSGTYGYIDLGAGNTFQEGDEIWVDMNGNGLRAPSACGIKLNKENSATDAVTVNPNCTIAANMPMYLRYVTKSTDPWVGQRMLYLRRVDSNDRLYQITIHRAPATNYTITYDANGGSGEMSNSTNTVSACTFTAPTNKEFKEWNTQADGNGTTVAVGATVTANTDLYAIWKDQTVKYAVTYNLGGASGDAPTEANKAAGDEFNLADAPSWSGHVFQGWLCNIDSEVKAAGASYTMTAAATTFTAQWKLENDATFGNGMYVLGSSALNVASLFSSTCTGDVTFALKAASEHAEITTAGAFTADAIGDYVVVATQVADATYAGVAKEATITVQLNPLGTGHVLTWNITTVSGSSESNVSGGTADIGTSSKSSTSSYLTTLTDLLGVGVKRTTTGKNSNTGKIETPSSYDANKYVSMAFTVADGYQFTPTAVSIKTVAVSTAKDLKFEFNDASNSYSVTKTDLSTNASAATNNLNFSSCDKAFTGTVTVKVYVYGADDQYRLSSPLTITGTVAEAGAAPSGYTVTYAGDKDGGSFPVDADVYASGAEVTVKDKPEGLTRTILGAPATFLGWSTNENMYGGTHYKAGDKFTITANTTLYAIWGFNITYIDEDKSTEITGLEPTYYIYGEGATLPTNPTAPTGYTFGGWYNAWCVDESSTSSSPCGENAPCGFDDTHCLTTEIGTTDTWDAEYYAKWILSAPTYEVTFNMNDHGAAIAKQDVIEGGTATAPFVADVDGWVFGGWYTDAECTAGNEFSFSTAITANRPLYAKWTADACSLDRQSLSKVVLTSATEGTVTGYNSNEYAGIAVIASLKDDGKTADIIGDATEEHGYKLNSSGKSIVFATLKKGDFQEGDKVIVGVIKKNDQRTVDESTDILTIYAGSDKDHVLEVATIKNVNAPGFYTYRLTAANATAINTAGYKSIGVFRASANGENHNIYSVEITGCRSWTITHNVTFDMKGHGTQVDPQVVAEGDPVTKPSDPVAANWAFCGWYKETTLENEWNFTTDVMGTGDFTLYAKWEDETGAIKLFDGEGNLNTTHFVSAPKNADPIEIASVEYPCLTQFAANRTSLGGAVPADFVQYNATTDAAKIKITLYNTNSGEKSALLYMVEEGDTEFTPVEIKVPGQTIFTTSYYTFNSTKNRSFYLCAKDRSNIRVLQVTVMDNGNAIHMAGQAGYSMNFNKGRMYVPTSAATSFEGATINVSSEYKVANNSSLATNSYISFTTTVDKTVLRVTRAGGNYYVSQDPDNKGTSYSTNQEIELSPAGTWYIGSINPGSAASFSKIEFIAPKCEEPAFNALANSDLCEGDGFAALDGTGTVSDGGTITYKWYAHGADESDPTAVLATTATYTPTADGIYYVKALHHVDGLTDNEVTSSEVTVTHFASAVITAAPANVRKSAGEAAALTVEATGKNLSYAWYTCDDALGTNPVAIVPAETNATLNVMVPDGIQYYMVIVSSDCGADLSAVAKVEKFVALPQLHINATTTWDLTTCADAEIVLTSSTSPKKGEECLMANIEGVHLDANFNSQALVISGEYIYRNISGKPTCAEYMKFITDVEGVVTVTFAGNGSNRLIRVTGANGVQYSTVSAGTGDTHTEKFYVTPGEVELMGMNAAMTQDKRYMRFFNITFTAEPDYIRPTTEGRYGTICLPNGGVMVGADLFEVAYYGATSQKIFFDQIMNGEMEAGIPYIFLPKEGVSQLGVYYTDAAGSTAGNRNGLYGSYTTEVLTRNDGNYVLYNNQYLYVGDESTNVKVGANRAYIKLAEITPIEPALAPGRRRVSMGVIGAPQVTTGVGELNADDTPIKVMIDGQLYIIRGEKMYDATGRLVK